MRGSLFSVRRLLVILGICWLVLIADQALILYWFNLPLKTAVIDSLISNFLLLWACVLIIGMLRYYNAGASRYSNMIILCIVLSIIWVYFNRFVLNFFLEEVEGYTAFLQHSLIIRGSVGFLVLIIAAMLGIIWYSLQEQEQNEQRKKDAEKLSRDAELYKLRQQLQPHFLFNSLNSINALISINPNEARDMVLQLSAFLRNNVSSSENKWISLQEELDHLGRYLNIEKVRFGNRLVTTIDCDETTQELRLPALILQPLVENAIKFGLYDTLGPADIVLKAATVDGQLQITIQNPYDPDTSSPRKGTGFGLSSVQRRLYLLFGRNDLLTAGGSNHVFTTQVTIPQIQPDIA